MGIQEPSCGEKTDLRLPEAHGETGSETGKRSQRLNRARLHLNQAFFSPQPRPNFARFNGELVDTREVYENLFLVAKKAANLIKKYVRLLVVSKKRQMLWSGNNRPSYRSRSSPASAAGNLHAS